MTEQTEYAETNYLPDRPRPRPARCRTPGCAARCRWRSTARRSTTSIDGGLAADRQRPVLARPGGLPRRQRVRHRPEHRRGQGADRRLQVVDRHQRRSRSPRHARRRRSPSRRPSCTRATGRRSASTPRSTPSRRTSSSPTPCSVPRLPIYGVAQPRRPVRRQQNFWWNAPRRTARRRAVAELRPPQRPERRRRPGDRPQPIPTRPARKAAAEDDQPDDGQAVLPDPRQLDAVGHAAQRQRAWASATTHAARRHHGQGRRRVLRPVLDDIDCGSKQG